MFPEEVESALRSHPNVFDAIVVGVPDDKWGERVAAVVHAREASLDETFFALSDPTRRDIITRLARGESTVSELAEPLAISAPAVSKHLRVLERAVLFLFQKLTNMMKQRI